MSSTIWTLFNTTLIMSFAAWLFREFFSPNPPTTRAPNGGRSLPEDVIASAGPLSRRDIYHAAFLLQQKLPPEIALQILEHAEYWLQSSIYVEREWVVLETFRLLGPQELIANGSTYVSSLPIGEVHGEAEGSGVAVSGPHPVRRVVFTIDSRDQGWSSYPDDHGTFRGSWTWFEAVVREEGQLVYQDALRAVRRVRSSDEGGEEASTAAATVEPPRGREICRNVHAGRAWYEQTVTWDAEDEDEEAREWVRGLKRGQVIDVTLWAMYPGWRNRIRSARVDVYTSAVR